MTVIYPSKDQLRETIRNGNDNVSNRLVLSQQGEFLGSSPITVIL